MSSDLGYAALGHDGGNNKRRKYVFIGAIALTFFALAGVVLMATEVVKTRGELATQGHQIAKMDKMLSDVAAILSQGSCPTQKKRQDDGGGDSDGGCTDNSIPGQLSTLAKQMSILGSEINSLWNATQNGGNGGNCGGGGCGGGGGACRGMPDVCDQLEGIGNCCSNVSSSIESIREVCADDTCCRQVNNTVVEISRSIQHCIPIDFIPYFPLGGNCYRLIRNFTQAAGVAISIVGQRNIDIYFDNYEIIVTAGVNPIFISNSTNIHIHEPILRSLIQRFDTASRGIRVEIDATGVSYAIFIYKPVIENMRLGITAVNCDITIIDGRFTGSHPGNGTQSVGIAGFLGTGTIMMKVIGGYASIPYLLRARTGDGFTTGVAISRGANDVGRANGFIDGFTADRCAIGVDVHRGETAIVKNVNVVMDPFSFGNAMQIGSGGTMDATTVENSVFSCLGDTPGADCVFLFNTRSLTMSGISIIGRAVPTPTYRAGLLHIGYPDQSGNLRRSEAIEINGLTVRSTHNDTIGIRIVTGGTVPTNLSVSIRHATIHGGRVGVLFDNTSRNVVFDDVTVAEAPYCFAAINFTSGVTVKNSNAFRCCRGYFADNTTTAVGIYNSFANSCSTSYLDQGTGNEFSVGFGTEGNNRVLGQTNQACAAPDLGPFVTAALPADDYPVGPKEITYIA